MRHHRKLLYILSITLIILFLIIYFLRSRNHQITVENKKHNRSNSISPSTNKWLVYSNYVYRFTISYSPSLVTIGDNDLHVDFIDAALEQDEFINPQNTYMRIDITQDIKRFQNIYTSPDGANIWSEAHAQDAVFTKVRYRVVDGYTAVDYI